MPLPRVTLDSQSPAALLDLGKHAACLLVEINSSGNKRHVFRDLQTCCLSVKLAILNEKNVTSCEGLNNWWLATNTATKHLKMMQVN